MITPDRLASWRRTADAFDFAAIGEKLRDACDEIERLQRELAATTRAKQENDERFQLAAAEQRERAIALEQQLAEIKDYAYRGGQNGEIVRRWILGVFEKDRQALEGGEG